MKRVLLGIICIIYINTYAYVYVCMYYVYMYYVCMSGSCKMCVQFCYYITFFLKRY